MHIQLVSTDNTLYRLCRETLAGYRGNDWTLNMGATPNGDASPDLFIWDCDSDVPLPRELDFEQERKNIFLVSRKKMAALVERLPMAAMAFLLKPVNKAALGAFLEQAVSRHERNRSADVDSLRADRDEILQCLLHANLKFVRSWSYSCSFRFACNRHWRISSRSARRESTSVERFSS